ncbi:MAG: aspartyl-phosphate phosphatase Spo0E family protein [Alicyclobacillus sp.]|nr:aspartyl-phosphate phosphatase Spo0E family protein [Alicyclobacillus sp.]
MNGPQRRSTAEVKLLSRIETLREQIRDTHERRGVPLTGGAILRLSQELDRLINAYMRFKGQEFDADRGHRQAGKSAS